MSNLYDLAEGIRRCTACPLWKTRTLAVPGEGPEKARLFFVGEAPGREEDRQGRPFVGRSGRFLEEMFLLAGIKKEEVFLTGSVKCHPPRNREPTARELKSCRELWLEKQIQTIHPERIILLGRIAAESLLGNLKLNQEHGKVFEKAGNKYFLTYHPSAGMRFPKIKKAIIKDFIDFKKELKKQKSRT